jgi:hypothetical protein
MSNAALHVLMWEHFRTALLNEEIAERARDKGYWLPLKKE